MKIIDCVQGSKEWHQARLGKITASRVHDILPGKSGYKAARKNYKTELICEILTGEYAKTYQSIAMEYGKELESIARSAYEAFTGQFVNEVGFIISDELEYLGCSPDGLYSDRGIEIKCPNTATHFETIIRYLSSKKKILPQYYTQMQTGMICTGLNEWEYISYDCRVPAEFQLYIDTIIKDEKYCELIIKEVKKFWNELKEALIKLEKYGEKWKLNDR